MVVLQVRSLICKYLSLASRAIQSCSMDCQMLRAIRFSKFHGCRLAGLGFIAFGRIVEDSGLY